MPLHDLPTMVPENNQKLEWVSIKNTQIFEFPFWVRVATATRTKTTVFVSGTPFCESQTPKTRAAKYGQDAVITCVKQSEFVTGRFPLDLVTTL